MGLHEEINELEQRFAESPDSRLFLPLADALRRAGELERAVKLCRDGLDRYTDFNSARILLGECLADMGELEEAETVLRESAQVDAGNRRINDRLADIGQQLGGGMNKIPAPAEEPAPEPGLEMQAAQEADEVEPEEPAAPAAEPSTGKTPNSGELFITHTLGDIYKLQGHDRKALEIYRKLEAEGQAGPEVKEKLRELSRRLGEIPPDEPTENASGGQVAGEAVLEMTRAQSSEGRFEERIDTIFHFLLGDSPEHSELEQQVSGAAKPASTKAEPGGSGEFVDMLEDWLEDIRQGK